MTLNQVNGHSREVLSVPDEFLLYLWPAVTSHVIAVHAKENAQRARQTLGLLFHQVRFHFPSEPWVIQRCRSTGSGNISCSVQELAT